MERCLTAEEVAEVLRLNVKTVHDLARRGELPAFRIGKFWRFDAERLKEYMQQRESLARVEVSVSR